VLTKEDKERILAGQAPASYGASGRPQISADSVTMQLCADQEWKCFWCGEKMDNDPDSLRFRTKDHVIPIATSKHGIKKLANIRAVCWECNQTRGQHQSQVEYRKHVKQLEEQLRLHQIALGRHKVTMAGRCYYCKLRFHVKEFFHKMRML